MRLETDSPQKFFDSNGVVVDRSSVVLPGGRTIAMETIIDAKVRWNTPNRRAQIFVLLSGFVVFMLNKSFELKLIGALMGLFAFAWALVVGSSYYMLVLTSNGSLIVLEGSEEKLISAVVRAINACTRGA
ncbi:TPA: DUF6232 family protein [Burkholderia orbicola]|uniref:DUF6232 family protein n=1 Tax=Burkholderia orbicola TaxID=2978683 RepID=UPI002655CF7A|nr:DUF6232 family protein [Burkholderia orbicola]MDN7535510.1 DUF6232 family protein [Burkholderia orbicola]